MQAHVLDGHIVLSRALAARNHYPAIDVMISASRVMREVVPPQHVKLAGQMREIMAIYREAEDLINIGAYSAGSNAKIDYALTRIDAINEFLCQGMDEKADLEGTMQQMEKVVLHRRSKDRDA